MLQSQKLRACHISAGTQHCILKSCCTSTSKLTTGLCCFMSQCSAILRYSNEHFRLHMWNCYWHMKSSYSSRLVTHLLGHLKFSSGCNGSEIQQVTSVHSPSVPINKLRKVSQVILLFLKESCLELPHYFCLRLYICMGSAGLLVHGNSFVVQSS